jgi:hypothetical protein
MIKKIQQTTTHSHIVMSRSRVRLVLQVSLLVLVFSCCDASLTIDRVEVKVWQPELGTCAVKVNKGPPKSVDYDVHAFKDAEDVMVRCGLV